MENLSVSRPNQNVFQWSLRMGLLVIIIAFCSSTHTLADTNKKSSQKQPFVHFNKPLLTVEADTVPIGVLLKRIAHETGIRILLKGQFDEPVSVARSSGTIERIIRGLKPDINTAFLYHAKGPESRHPQLTDIFIITDPSRKKHAEFKGGDRSENLRGAPDSEDLEITEREAWIRSMAKADIPQLAEALLRDADPQNRQAAVEILGNLATGRDQVEAVTELLHQAMKDKDVRVRLTAVHSLATRSDGKAVAILKEAILDANPEVRTASLHLMGSRGMITPVEILALGLKDADPWVRIASVPPVADMENTDTANLLQMALEDPDKSVREVVQRSISQSRLTDGADEAKNSGQ